MADTRHMNANTDTVAVTYELERMVESWDLDYRLRQAAAQVRRAADMRIAGDLAEAREWLSRAAITLRDYEGLRPRSGEPRTLRG